MVLPVLETNNLVCAWRVEVSMDPHEIFLVELPEVGTQVGTAGRTMRFYIWWWAQTEGLSEEAEKMLNFSDFNV